MELICTFSIPNYTHEDFAEENFRSVAFFDTYGKVREVKPITSIDIYNLWLCKSENIDGWDGELISWEVKK